MVSGKIRTRRSAPNTTQESPFSSRIRRARARTSFAGRSLAHHLLGDMARMPQPYSNHARQGRLSSRVETADSPLTRVFEHLARHGAKIHPARYNSLRKSCLLFSGRRLNLDNSRSTDRICPAAAILAPRGFKSTGLCAENQGAAAHRLALDALTTMVTLELCHFQSSKTNDQQSALRKPHLRANCQRRSK